MSSGAGKSSSGVRVAWAWRPEGFFKEERLHREGPGLRGCPRLLKGNRMVGSLDSGAACLGSNDYCAVS